MSSFIMTSVFPTNNISFIRLEVLTTVTMKVTLYLDVTPCCLRDYHPCLRETISFFLEDGGNRILQKACNDLPDYMMSHPRRQ